MSRFVFVSERTFEPWDWRNPDVQGIGGSETSHIEMARRLAELGHEVISFAPLGHNTEGLDLNGPAGVPWFTIENLEEFLSLDPSTKDTVFIIYRAPNLVDLLPSGAIAWLICQDVDYTFPGRELNEERALKFTRIVALCEKHAEFLRRRVGTAADRVCVSSNGIKIETIADLLEDPPERNLKRLIYASSPDRGLEYLLPIFTRVRELVPDAELHVCYGFDNIEKVIARPGSHPSIAAKRAELLELMKQPGVFHYGRMGQPELLKNWLQSAIWCHPSNFTETSCITCMDAQACGAVPVTSPVWAIGENVQHGVFIEGDVRNELVRARYVRSVVELLLNPQIQGEYRAAMMPWALTHFAWSRFAKQWEHWGEVDVVANDFFSTSELGEMGAVCK